MKSQPAVGGADQPALHRIAAVIPAHNVARDIAATVRACRAIPGVDLLVVVDDGSDDETGRAARAAGAVVVRHSVPRGRASAMETGVKVAAMRDHADLPARHILFLSGDLGESAVEATSLVEAVVDGRADCAVGVNPSTPAVKGSSVNMARRAIRRATGWDPLHPLAHERCVTREVLNAVMPFSNGHGLEVALAIDLLSEGFSIIELPCAFTHLAAEDAVERYQRPVRYAETIASIVMKWLKRKRLSKRRKATKEQKMGEPYPLPASERRAAQV
ncbi:MAG: glycosyltransferase [Actinomycetaceae bacterium]|nr:glycosyltransferase [Actinomycetaceae bacterium]